MRLDKVVMANLRNIERAEMHPAAGVNWLVGGNGAGKTSVLEGIYLLARGNSFRLSRVGPVIRRGATVLRVHGQGTKDSGLGYSVGVERTASTCRVRINGETAHRISDLVVGLPLQIIGSNSFHILDRGPSFRRRLLDWGVFHVEHAYRSWYSDYDRCLRQRNAALRSRQADFWIWDSELARTAERITAWRHQYTAKISEFFVELTKDVPAVSKASFQYKQGWPLGEPFADFLRRTRRTDATRGYTTAGIHTADLQVLVEGKPALEVLSRGHQKLFVVLLHLAQGKAVQQYAKETPVMLVDDLPSELDEPSSGTLLELIRERHWQCFLTTVDERYSDAAATALDQMFHVKHGQIST